jgi:hypothetical protein
MTMIRIGDAVFTGRFHQLVQGPGAHIRSAFLLVPLTE